MPVLLTPAAATGAATGVGIAAVEQAVQQLAGAFADFMRRRSDDVFPVALEAMRRADPQMTTGDARRLAGIELEYEAEYQRKALERITRDLRIAMANPDARARQDAVTALLTRERRYQQQREEAIATRALARAEQQTLKRTSPQGAYWMLSDYVSEHTLDCLALAGQFWPWDVLERYGPPRHHGCPCYLIGLEEAKSLGLMTDADIPDPADARVRVKRLLTGLDEARQDAAFAVGRAALRGRELTESAFTAHAERELRRAGLFDKDSDYGGMVGKAVMKLIRMMSGQGHSGFSAGLVTDLFSRLARYENLTPLTDDPGEWNHIAEPIAGQPDLWQSSRRPDAFSNDAGKTYYLLGDHEENYVEDGMTWTRRAPEAKWPPLRRSEPAGRPVEASISVNDSNWSPTGTFGMGHASIVDGAYLDEATARKQWNQRYSRGTTKGGQFRPRRGGAPGTPTLAGVVGRGHARKLARSPVRDRERGRWVPINGHPVRVPERAWSRRVNGVKYTSPAGGTNVYRDGQLVSEPGQPPTHRALAVPMKRSPGSTVTDVPADVVPDLLTTLGNMLRGYRDPTRRAIRERMSLGKPPLEVGDGPDAIDAARAEGFTLGAVGPGKWLNLHHDAGKLRVRMGDAGIAEVRWVPHERTPRNARELRQPPDGWEDHARDALALADELGAQYNAQVRVPRIVIDPDLADHAGRHEWSGAAVIGREARSDMEAVGAARRAGRPLNDFEARGAYASMWATAHEVLHGVNPIPEEMFQGADANLEEALTEELSHPIALARLRQRGEPDVVKWAMSNPDALPVQGVYLPERGALASLLDAAHITNEKARLHFLSELKFETPPAERLAVIADALTFGDFENWDSAYDHVVLTMEHPDGKSRSALSPGAIAFLDAPQDLGPTREPESPGVPLMRDRNGAHIRVGDEVTVAGVAGGVGDTGVAIATTGRRLRYVSDREADPLAAEKEVPQSRVTKGLRVPRRMARTWDPRVEGLRQLDTGTALVAQQALNGDATARWELARRLGDLPADDPVSSAILSALPGLEPIRAPTSPLHSTDVDGFLAGAAYGAVLHHGTTTDLAKAILGGDMPDRDTAHKGRMYGEGFYLTNDRAQARESPRKGQAPGAVLDVAVRLDRPLMLDGDDTSVVGRLIGRAKTERVTDLPVFVRDQLQGEGYDGVVRRWPDGSTWVAVFEPDSGQARAVIDPPMLAQLSPSSRGPTRVAPEQHGPDIGVRYERDPVALTTAERLADHFYGNRQTGHFGTGVYFLSSPTPASSLSRGDRTLVGVDLGAGRLHRPASDIEAFDLHDTLGRVNDLAHAEAGDDLTVGVAVPRLLRVDDLAQRLPPGADGVQDLVRAEGAIRDGVAGARRDREDGLLDTDTASTRAMRALGFDGVDVRHLPELDNAIYGSVVYRPQLMDGGIGRDHMLSGPDAQAWIADAPAGGWSGIVYHGTSPQAAAGIEASGFDFERSRGYGMWFADEPLDRFGAAQVTAAVRLERVAGDEDMRRIRASLPAGLLPSEQADAIRDELRAEGFDGYRGSYGDGRMVVAVVNPAAVRVMEPQQGMEQRGDGAVVGGRRGRWVWIRGMYRHIRLDAEHDEQADGVRFVSPADTSFVYRFDPASSAAAFGVGDKVLARNLDDNGWRAGTVTGPGGGGMMVGVDWDGGRHAIMSARDLGTLVSKPRWNGHNDVRDPRYGGTRREGAPEPRRRAARRVEPAPPPPVDPALSRARERFPNGTRVRVRDRDNTEREVHGEVKDVRLSNTGRVEVQVEWSTGTTSEWLASEIEPVPGSRQPDWRNGQRARTSVPTGPNGHTIIEGTLTRRAGSVMHITDDDGNIYPTSMERLMPVVPEQGARVRVHREDGSVFEATIDTVITRDGEGAVTEVIVELANGERFGLLHAGRLDILDPPERRPDMGILLTDDDRAGLMTIPRPTNPEPFELAPNTGIWYHPDSPEIAHGFKLPDQLVIGPAFFELPAGDRDYHLHRALGFGLAAAMENDPETWQEAQNAWTAGAFSANGRHLDRYSLHAAIATGYARLAAPPNLDRATAERDAFPDAGRLIALAADEHGYPLDAMSLDWARGRQTGGPDPEPPDDPAARFAAQLPNDLQAAQTILRDAGFEFAGSRLGSMYTRMSPDNVQIIELDAEGRVQRATTLAVTHGDDELIRSLHGYTVHAASTLLTHAGWVRDYSRLNAAFVSPDLRRSLTITGDRAYGTSSPLDRVYIGPATLSGQANALRSRAGVTADSLLAALHVGLDESVVRNHLGSRWTVSHDDRGILTLQALENANTAEVTAHEVRMRFENGRIAEVGLPDAGDAGISQPVNGVTGPEYAARVGAITARLRREFTEREARRVALAEQIRTRISAGTEPFNGTESFDDVMDAMRRLRFDGGSTPRALQNGGISITFKNRRNGAKVIARFGPSSATTTSRYEHAGRIVAARSRVQPGTMVGERERTHGHLAATESGLLNDILGRSDELAARYGTTSVTQAVRFDHSGYQQPGFSGVHGWDGTIVLGQSALPAMTAAREAQQAGRPLTDLEARNVYAAFKLAQHEVNHGVRTGTLQYRHEDGTRGFEEALTEELAHAHVVEWLRDVGLPEVVTWADRNRSHTFVQGTYQKYRQAFGGLLDEAGVAPEDRYALFVRWKHQTDSGLRVDELAGMIARNQAIAPDAAKARIRTTLSRTSGDTAAAFRPLLIVDRGGPAPAPTPTARRAPTLSVRTAGGDTLRVGDTFRGSAPDAVEGTITDIDDQHVNVRWPGGRERTWPLTRTQNAMWTRTGLAVQDGSVLRAGDRFAATSANGQIVRFEPNGQVVVRWDHNSTQERAYPIDAVRSIWRRLDASGGPVDLGARGRLTVGGEVLVPGGGRRRLPMRRGRIMTITEGSVGVDFGNGQSRAFPLAHAQDATRGWVTPDAQRARLRPWTRVEVRGSRGTFTGTVRSSYARDGKLLVRRDGATRGSRYPIEAIRPLEPDVAPGPTPAPGPEPTPSTATLRLSGGGTIGVGGRMRGAATGKLCTVLEIDGQNIRFRRDDGTTGRYGPDQFRAIVITEQGDELKIGDRVRGPGVAGVGPITDIDWTQPTRPRVKTNTSAEWIDARPLEPGTPTPWMTIANRRGEQIPVERGTKVVLRDGTIAEAVERTTLGSWPDVRTGQVRARGVSGPRINAAFTLSAADIVGIAGEQPNVPAAWGSSDRDELLRKLADQHYRRVRTQKATAQLLGAQLGAPIADQIQQWWEVNNLPTRRVNGEQRAVIDGTSVRFPDVISHLYGRAYESEDALNAMRTGNPKAYAMLEHLAMDAQLPWPNWRERVRPDPPVVAPPGNMFDEAVLRATWSGTFGRKGFRSEVASVYTDGTRTASISGIIYNARGTRVGNFNRNVSVDAAGNPTVYHALLTIQRRSQGSGFAKAFNRHAEAIYRAKGVKKVTVSANIDVGGYAWAATGFDFNVDRDDTMTPLARAERRAKQARQLIDSTRDRGGITTEQYNLVIDQFIAPGLTVSEQSALEGKITHAWELAHLGPNHEIGKAILLNRHWSGVKHLVGPERSPLAG